MHITRSCRDGPVVAPCSSPVKVLLALQEAEGDLTRCLQSSSKRGQTWSRHSQHRECKGTDNPPKGRICKQSETRMVKQHE